MIATRHSSGSSCNVIALPESLRLGACFISTLCCSEAASISSGLEGSKDWWETKRGSYYCSYTIHSRESARLP